MKISLSIMSYYSFFPPDFCKTKCLAWYLAELTLLDAETYSSFKPSIIAAACVALARHNDGLEAWDSIITKMTGIGVEELIRQSLRSTSRTGLNSWSKVVTYYDNVCRRPFPIPVCIFKGLNPLLNNTILRS